MIVSDPQDGLESGSGAVARRETAVLLLGRPGSGKGTQAQLLADSGWSHINVGGLVRYEVAARTSWGITASALMMRGELLPSIEIQRLIERNFDRDKLPVVIEGYPRRLAEADTLRAILGPAVSLIPVFLDAPLPTSISRIMSRVVCVNCGIATTARTGLRCLACAGPLASRDDDRYEDVVRMRQQMFDDLTVPLIEHYRSCDALEIIDSDRDHLSVHADLLARIRFRGQVGHGQ